MTLTYETAVEHLLKNNPFEGSGYERSAIDVYEHGLNCDGRQEFATLDDALGWWLEAYERDVHELAQLMDGCEAGNPFADALLKWEVSSNGPEQNK
jgi:hypothetical protein